ncbi:MAG: hypothetical protein OXK80_00265 [Bdellovibrionales bacterium]|nr:hypothetical protein [Bdellovibrionales bacterium]
MINHQCKGSISVDFLFSITVSCLLLMFVILTSLTFSLVEVAQYVAYATARTYFIGHENPGAHESAAVGQFDALRGKFFKSGVDMSQWFFLSNMTIYDGQSTGLPPDGLTPDRRTRFGVGFTFTSKVLTMNIPFLGKVGSGNDGFAFPIAAFLGREVSASECVAVVGSFVQGGNGC